MKYFTRKNVLLAILASLMVYGFITPAYHSDRRASSRATHHKYTSVTRLQFSSQIRCRLFTLKTVDIIESDNHSYVEVKGDRAVVYKNGEIISMMSCQDGMYSQYNY